MPCPIFWVVMSKGMSSGCSQGASWVDDTNTCQKNCKYQAMWARDVRRRHIQQKELFWVGINQEGFPGEVTCEEIRMEVSQDKTSIINLARVGTTGDPEYVVVPLC